MTQCYGIKHTQRLTVTRVVLGTGRKREEVRHKLTGSSLVTQHVYERATACHRY